MDTNRVAPDAARELPPPGMRSGEGTETLWQHLARDEQRKTSNRGGGQRETSDAQQAAHPMRRATDWL